MPAPNVRALTLPPGLRARLACIRAISFDGDGTLWDFEAGMLHGLDCVLAALREKCPGPQSAALTVAELVVLRDAAESDMPAATLEAIRLEGMRRAVASAGGSHDDEALACALFDLYYQARHAALCLYPDTVPALEALGARYPLALLSNGNTDPVRAGLNLPLALVQYAAGVGVAKPDPRFFHLACEQLGCAPGELLHVGDDPVCDVAGAQAAGVLSIWLDRAGPAARAAACGAVHAKPDLTIGALTDLPSLLNGAGGAYCEGGPGWRPS